MCPAAILGDRASGKTTFLGALYSTLVETGSGPNDDFRFFAGPDALRFMSSVRETMLLGSFPAATLKEQVTQVEFTFGFRTLWKKIGLDTESRLLKPWKGIRFGAYDVSGEDVQEYIESGAASSPIIKELLQSNVVVILVDCGRMTLDRDSPAYKEMLHYDSDVARLIVNFATFKIDEARHRGAAGRSEAPPVIFPAIVLTKTDQIRAETLHELGLPQSIPEGRDRPGRQAFCEGLLRSFLPQTLAQLRGGKVAGVSFDRAEYFACWIKTVTSDGGMAPVGKPRISLTGPGAGHPAMMDYSRDEYLAFIDYFRRIAKQVADVEAEDEKGLAAS